MRRVIGLLLVAGAATGALVVVGTAVLGSDDGGDAGGGGGGATTAAAAYRPAPLSAYDATGVSLQRGAFCARVDPRLVRYVLGGPATAQRSWNDGDRTLLSAGLTDVAHEFGCEYGAAEVTARAWVFAPPVGRAQATRWAKATDSDLDADSGSPCTSTTAAFGAPSSMLACQTSQLRSVTYRGLFGDTWLSCELVGPLAVPASQLVDRAGRWCVGVAQAADAGSGAG